MPKADVCRKLHAMVDDLLKMEDFAWDNAYPMIQIVFRSRDDEKEAFALIVGVEPRRITTVRDGDDE